MTREEYEELVDKKLHDFQVKNLNEYESRLKQLKQKLMSEFKEEKPSLDGWKDKDKYYFIGSAGIIVEDLLYRGDNTAGEYRVTHGNAFRTYEEAEFKRERDTVLYELSKFAEPEDREWNGSNNHWFICWNYREDRIGFDLKYICKHNGIYFATREDAEKAIQAVGEDRIKKYYLEVEE